MQPEIPRPGGAARFAAGGRAALSKGFATACGLLALTGGYEFFTGHAGRGILVAAIVEIALAMAFATVRGRAGGP